MKKHNFRKGLLAASALVLVAVISVGATLAYLTASTREVVNTFTAGEGIDIEIQEPSYKGDKTYTPGTTFDKDPEVKNTSTGDSPVYIVASLEYQIDGVSVSYATFTAAANEKHATILKSDDTAGFNAGWTQLTDTDANKDYFVYGTKTAPTSVDKANSTTEIFTKVKISEKDTGDTTYKIIVNAYAVNADNGVTADVFNELAGLTGNKISKDTGLSFK